MRTRKIVEIGPEVTVLETLCPECWQTTRHELDTVAFRRWQGGELVQWAFSEMSVDKREQLISGTCGGCWEKLFAEEDEAQEQEKGGVG